jgi:hypothetical protein
MMKFSLPWPSATRRLAAAGRALARLFGPLPPSDPGATFTPGFRVSASYGRFVFSLHALAPRADPLCQADVHDATRRSQAEVNDWPARHPGEMALIAKTQRRPRTASRSGGR